MAKAIIFERPGGPSVLKYKDINVKKPGYGEALVENHVIGLNFIDTYHQIRSLSFAFTEWIRT